MPMMVMDCDMKKKREEISVPRMETRQEAGRPHRKAPGRFHLERSNRALFLLQWQILEREGKHFQRKTLSLPSTFKTARPKQPYNWAMISSEMSASE